uniref:Erythroid differentiation-related factor 1 n=1 Tax=Noccaea caerulescens TaxID=107243 RepID=A0A1J3JP34_NOCCA
MEQSVAPKPPPMPLPYLPSSVEGCRDLQCIGKMEIVAPKPVGFLCGSIPVLADNSFPTFTSALLPSQETVIAPRYQMLPRETDLNRLPLLTDFPDKVLPLAAVKSRITGDISKEANVIASNLSKKCEALAVSGLVEYGDEIDVIAPVDVLKQIFKIPYSKARVSIAVQRVGQTLVLNPGPDVEEGEKLIRRQKNQPKCTKNVDESLFLNFAMHSVRMEACDCPPTHRPDIEKQSLPAGENSHGLQQSSDSTPDDRLDKRGGSSSKQLKQDGFICEKKKKSKKNKVSEPMRKDTQISEKIKPSGESEKHRRSGNNEFLRVLFWQFHNFRMLLGSDLLLFSNEKYVAVSLHLFDVSQEVTPLTWLEAWLDNVMASVPELAICYHQKGVVQGYELLKTDDIFLLKGISEDGTPAFHPHVVQQNGHAVLRFLQSNCKEDPGAYWLYKSAGEDVIQLFDSSLISKNHSASDNNDSANPLPSFFHSGRSDSLFSLGNLLYRVGHRLSLSVVPNDRTKCARFLRKCLNFLDEPNHMVVRAYAHEQFARLILSNDEEVDLTFESNNVQREVQITDLEEEPLDPVTVVDNESEAVVFSQDKFTEDYSGSSPLIPTRPKSEADVLPCKELSSSDGPDSHDAESSFMKSNSDNSFDLAPAPLLQTIISPISSKLAAVHHVSQAIKSLRWTRQLQSSEQEGAFHNTLPSVDISKCACGDPDCIEVCDIRNWLPTSKLDRKLWNLVLLLGESYLSLGEAYKDDGQLHQALNTVELACSIYGSMPQKFEETLFVSSMNKSLSVQSKSNAPTQVEDLDAESGPGDISFAELSSTRLFWAKVWMLVGDIYVEFHILKGQELSRKAEETSTNQKQLKMPSEVVKEVKRLKKKLTEYSQNCASCSLVNCSCKSDRASSGSSASSSSSNGSSARTVPQSRKQNRKSKSKNVTSRLSRNVEDECVDVTAENRSHKEEDTSVGTKDESNSKEPAEAKKGGIFKYLKGSETDDAESNLLSALKCYEETRRALHELPSGCSDFQSVVRKKGWVCNELGRNRLGSKELRKAEDAFADAITAFKEVCDHTNVILINCNLGHGRRALAEEMVPKMEALKLHPALKNAYQQSLETAKLEYSKSLKYYMAAKTELSVATEEVPENLRVEVYTQLAHTYLRFGMLLAKEDTTAAARGQQKSTLENTRDSSFDRRVSASDAIREALALYESLGEIRKQEAAYAYLQLARYHKECCMRFLESERQGSLAKPETNVIQRAKQYALLADRNWQKSMDFYGPENHPCMFLTILIERSALSLSLSNLWQSNTMLESALSRLLEGRHISKTYAESLRTEDPELYLKFLAQLQMVLKRMLALSLPGEGANKSHNSGRSGDSGKLRELYKTSLKSTSLSDLNTMHILWTSSSYY